MQTPREASIVRAILKYINDLPRCYAEKVHGNAYNAGAPDITGCIAGRRLEIEVKRPGRDATPLQARKIELWRRAGAIVGVCHSVAEVKDLLAAHEVIR